MIFYQLSAIRNEPSTGGTMKKLLVAIFCLAGTMFAAPKPTAADSWKAFGSLLGGTWEGEGSGEPGNGTGGFSFRLDLQGKVMVRRSTSSYPATKDHPAFTHEDLMVISRESEAPLRADYYDNEGHVIHYTISVSENGKSAQFLSDLAPSAPRYRLTYESLGTNEVTIKFEIAPPGKPDAFTSYVEAKARRKSCGGTPCP
jgi:hypothetical protein